ncbi:L-serine dehydratase, beta chain [Thermoanaerobacter kivui]|uniref:L-serine deaminase n=1 Tax=Thermoanaerobacter kivui TaxID=2325 RepID=A0A097AR08_THEKI|nr:L-serine ammonia-lyase, iron-sulfur-dependent subunit beta [Thermoanaerobacter kivui]AIS52255.1 L-serine dehydratase, beta chain [Thermoanaerobacter kivui]
MRDYSVFDILGPIMVGPSSSHTAGAARLAKIARKIVEEDVSEVEFILYESFAHTYKGHGTDKALVAGILGFDPDDERLPYSFEIARQQGMRFKFIESDEEAPHPNTVRMIITGKKGQKNNILGCSIGGGNVLLKEINGIEVEFSGEYETLITNHIDKPGIVASVTKIFANYKINIAFMRVYRHSKGDKAIMVIESDQKIPEDAKEAIKNIDGILNAIIINTI